MLTVMCGIAREKRRKERSLKNTINPAGEVTWWLKHLPPKCGPEFLSSQSRRCPPDVEA